jgi:hypothetical protein
MICGQTLCKRGGRMTGAYVVPIRATRWEVRLSCSSLMGHITTLMG